MGANDTPIPDLIEISGIEAHTDYTATDGGGGNILGLVDNATYTDDETANSDTQITQLNDWDDADAGFLTIDGKVYGIELADPANSPVTITTLNDDGTEHSFDLTGDGGTSQIVFIEAIPLDGGPSRFFALMDDNVGDVGRITSIQTQNINHTPAGDDIKINADQNNNVQTVCFCAGTMIATPAGLRAVETIAPGDPVLTMDSGIRPVIWAGGLRVSADQMRAGPNLAPIRIERDALAPGHPQTALSVSPQHRILLRSVVAERMFGTAETLIPAVKLLGLPGVDRVAPVDTHYVHLLLDTHEILFANGAPAESLFVAEHTRRAMGRDLSFRIAARGADRTAARRIVERRGDVDELLRRIAKNEKLALEPAT